ncbi:prephenate dehydrogenase [Dyella tabacisoli]|uniref:Prephenate dehydrogenase n=1 Tax=Dyella tabacisoli TaxID=2282381 RepID=A0A369UP21_9GAMM|nr:prephenate dehydrogenase [Dyella tabacisoli]RDD81370.1 prephenate dehydrogenase [Dyella tabacisoli]
MFKEHFKTAVVIGAGAVGQMFAQLLTERGTLVTCFDSEPRNGAASGDACQPSGKLAAAAADAELIVLALPERALSVALERIGALARRDALLVETSSVKTPLESIKHTVLRDREVLGVNPMFAPSAGIAGHVVVTVHHGAGPASTCFEQLLAAHGARLVALSAERHDRMTALVQALGHAAILGFADALAHAGEPLDDLLAIAPPPFRVLMSLVARMLGQSPEVYWDIQSGNPHAIQARALLADGVDRCNEAGGTVPLADFETWLAQLTRYGGPALPALGTDCARLFASLPPSKSVAANEPLGVD